MNIFSKPSTHYDLGGKKFKSLSAVAKAITGTSWNGFRFFALGTGRKG